MQNENNAESNEQKETPRNTRRTSKSKRIILMGKSEIAGKMVPMDWGTFDTIGAAEIFARNKFKILSWAVGEEVTKKDSFGKVLETKYDLVTQIINPRRRDEE